MPFLKRMGCWRKGGFKEEAAVRKWADLFHPLGRCRAVVVSGWSICSSHPPIILHSDPVQVKDVGRVRDYCSSCVVAAINAITKSHFEGKVGKGLFQLTLPQVTLREVRSGGRQGRDLSRSHGGGYLLACSWARVQLAFLNSPDPST